MAFMRIRLSGTKTYLAVKELKCDYCEKYIIKDNKAEMPIYYSDSKYARTVCPECKP